jgi:uncharacterized protein
MLASVIIKYEIIVYINDKLLEELERNIIRILKNQSYNAIEIIEEIKRITFYTKTIDTFTTCPDPKDNFLFDLAIQTNSDVIVTQEKVLLQWAESPVLVHDIKWFKEHFPVA